MLRAVLVALAFWAVAAVPAEGRVIEYRIDDLGAPAADKRLFAFTVDAVLNHPRGWSLGGAVRFRRVRRGGSWTVTLAAPGVMPRYGGCSAYWSCYSGGRVLINDARWRFATRTYRGRLDEYRRLVVNHEVGHALGFGHAFCGGRGRNAPVMQQQSKALGGCRRNPWPAAHERRALAYRLGVRVRRRPVHPLVPGRSIGPIRLGMTGAQVRAHAPRGLEVAFRAGRVSEVSTRSRHFESWGGARVGISVRRLRVIVPGARCDPLACVAGATTFRISRGRVARVTIGYAASRESSTSSRSDPQWSGALPGRMTAFG